MTYRPLLCALALAAAACRYTVTNEGGNATVANPFAPTPTNPTSPTPPPTFGPRTPDPAPGMILPFPTYAGVVAATVPPLGLSSCTSSVYLDAVVDALRARDTRWGYVCKAGNCANVSQDAISYHATAGPEVAGALGVYVVDVIKNFCTVPETQFLFIGYEAGSAWTGRGRF